MKIIGPPVNTDLANAEFRQESAIAVSCASKRRHMASNEISASAGTPSAKKTGEDEEAA